MLFSQHAERLEPFSWMCFSFDEEITPIMIFFMFFILIGVIGLNLFDENNKIKDEGENNA